MSAEIGRQIEPSVNADERGRRRTAGPARPVRITVRDRFWLRWGGRQRVFGADQLAVIAEAGSFARGPEANGDGRHPTVARVRRRLAELRVGGCVEPVRIFAGAWDWRVTSRGLRVAGLDLEAARINYRQYAHDIDCGWLAIELEREFGERVWTEREIWAHDHRATTPAFCPAEIRSGRPRLLRVPDLAIEGWGGEGEPLAVELERTCKSRARMHAVVALYASCPYLAGVHFYCTDQARRGVERAIRALGYGAERFEIRDWQPRREIRR